MEAVIRAPYQGITNIVRFNWHLYAVAGFSVLLLLFASIYAAGLLSWLLVVCALGVVTSTAISLFVSYYVYDRSGLYDFPWLSQLAQSEIRTIVNVHAGFDETSSILKTKYPSSKIKVFDFYDPSKHTQSSIARARKAYSKFDGTIDISTTELPLEDRSVDLFLNIFALHEIRVRDERTGFLKEQARAMCDCGRLIIVEHLRDMPNFFAYNIGFFHFLPETEWKQNFQSAGLTIDNKFNVTPFVTVTILRKANGITP